MDNKHYPDILTCIANLSSDEIFTSPQLANKILDLLPNSLWSNKDIKFLDPCCKTGVFLREITKRLIKGLEKQIPILQDRINHILTKQVYGMSITKITHLLTKRSIYCSKVANGKYSICNIFESEDGNILSFNSKHKWNKNNVCEYCNVNKDNLKDNEFSEQYAYDFIHLSDENEKEIINMKFDVIVGNPPYHMNDGGGSGSSAIALYNKFIEQAIKLNPRYITMIIPSRWMLGGKGLDKFREMMFTSNKIVSMVDYINSSDCFSGVDINGGVCYFLWDKNYNGKCNLTTIDGDNVYKSERYFLNETNDFIRYSKAISIIEKIKKENFKPFSSIVSNRNAFNIPSNEKINLKKDNDKLELTKFYGFKQEGYLPLEYEVTKNKELKDSFKVLIPKGLGDANINKRGIFLKPIIAPENSVCSETYLVIGPLKDEQTTKNVSIYMKTKFFHFLFGMKRISQNTTKDTYGFVPLVDFSISWNDKLLYKEFNLTNEEIEYIESFFKEKKSV